jgi:hypothetical protein
MSVTIFLDKDVSYQWHVEKLFFDMRQLCCLLLKIGKQKILQANLPRHQLIS